MSRGNCGTAFSGTAMMTTSWARAACSTVAAVAPISAESAANEVGPRELAIDTWCPSAVRCRARVLPMLPEPMIPMFMYIFFSVHYQYEQQRLQQTLNPIHANARRILLLAP